MKFFIRSLFLLSLLFVPTQSDSQTASLLPNAVQQFFDNNGNPLSSGTVTTYIAGTSTLKTTWKNSTETIANTNPIVLDAGGKAIIYGDGTYRQVVKDRNGNLIWDAVTAPGGGGGATTFGDGTAVGTTLPWSGIVPPPHYMFAYGQTISRVTYANLFTAITINQNVICTASSPVLTSVPDTTQIPIGANVEASCIPAGSTVTDKTSNTITVSSNANISINNAARFFPFGNGNGSNTFGIPDLRGRVIAGRNNMGGTANIVLTTPYYRTNPNAIGSYGGNQGVTIGTSNLPAYTPTGTISVSSTTATGTINITDPGHTHTVPLSSQLESVGIGGTNITLPGGSTTSSSSVTGLNSSNVLFAGVSHTHTATFTGVAQGGVNDQISVVQPTLTLNYIIKVLPDETLSTLNVVTSINSMIGAITCSGLVICSGNDISIFGVGDGDVVGPSFSNDGYISLFNGTTGKLIKQGVGGAPWQAQVHQNFGGQCFQQNLCWGNQNLSLTADHISILTADASEFTQIHFGGNVAGGDVGKQVGATFVVNGVSFPILYTIQSGDDITAVATGFNNRLTPAILEPTGIIPIMPILGTANNGGAVQIQVASTATIKETTSSTTIGIQGTTGGNGNFPLHIDDATHITLVGSVYNAPFIVSPGTALETALLAFTDANGFGYYLLNGKQAFDIVAFDYPWGTSNSITPANGGSSVVVTKTNQLDNGPYLGIVRSPTGRPWATNDILGVIQFNFSYVTTGIQSNPTDPISPGTYMSFSTGTPGVGVNNKLYIGQGVFGAYGNPCPDPGLGYWLTCTGMAFADTSHKIFNTGAGALQIQSNDAITLSRDGGTSQIQYTSSFFGPNVGASNTISLGGPTQLWSGLHATSVDAYSQFIIHGTSSGGISIQAPAVAGSNTITLPAGTTDFSLTGGTSQVVKQVGVGAALTVGRLACADLSDSGTGCTGTSSGGGTVTSVATTSPITGGTFTTSGTIACATCVTSAAALTANQIVLGAGLQATAALGSLGTTTTVLHGNAAGAPTFGAVANADLVNASTTVNGQTCTLGSTCIVTASATSITVDSTAISSGTTTRILYDNAGTLGEYTLTGTGTVVAMQTSPTFVTDLTTPIVKLSGTSNQLVFQSAGVTGTISWSPSSTNKTITLPNGSTDFTGTTGIVQQASSGAAFTVGSVALSNLATQATNTIVGNSTSGTAVPTALAIGSCSTASSALIWTTNTGFGCNTSITAAAVPVGGITGLGTGVATFLATPTSANLAAAVTDETGSGALVFGTSPTLTTAVAAGTWTASGTWTLPAHTLGGLVSGNGQMINNLLAMVINSTDTTSCGGAQCALYIKATSGSPVGAYYAGNVPANDQIQMILHGAATNTDMWQYGNQACTGGVGQLFEMYALNSVNACVLGISSTNFKIYQTLTVSNMGSDATHTDNTVCIDSSTGLTLKGSGTLGICLGTSSARYKNNIIPLNEGLKELVNYNPKNFFYKKGYGDDGAREQYGFIAEDIIKVTPKLVALDIDGKPNSVDMLGMIPIIVNSIKQLKADNDNLRLEIQALKRAKK